MKKKSGSRTVGFFKKLFNLKYWTDWNRLKSFTQYLLKGTKRFLIPPSGDKVESFDAVKAKMHLSEADLLSRQRALFRLSLLMTGISIMILCYALFQLISGHFAAFFLSIVVSLIALVLAFRYHFWHFLIKERKLQCSISEWFRQGILGRNYE